MDKDFLYFCKSVMVGHAVGDALGVPVEFSSREELKINPVVEMEGYGTFPVPKGTWSDDTSMGLCALDALCDEKINFDKIMLNFGKWYLKDEFTATNETFDIGNTCSIAIERYLKEDFSWKECGLSDEKSNGNGSLMRIHPFVLYTYLLKTTIKTKIEIIELASALTHAHKRSKIACGIYAFILWEILSSPKKQSITVALKKAKEFYSSSAEINHYNRLFDSEFKNVSENSIKSGGYVVDTLESVIWCLLNTSSYKECVLKAVNLGDDTDTVAAIAGGLAGCIYGYDNIPKTWLKSLLKRDYIENLTEKAFKK